MSDKNDKKRELSPERSREIQEAFKTAEEV
jgi:hypothetical protein